MLNIFEMLKNTLEAFSHAVLDKMERKTRERKRGMEQKTKKKIAETINGGIRAAIELLIWFGVGTAAFFAIFFLLRYMGVWE